MCGSEGWYGLDHNDVRLTLSEYQNRLLQELGSLLIIAREMGASEAYQAGVQAAIHTIYESR